MRQATNEHEARIRAAGLSLLLLSGCAPAISPASDGSEVGNGTCPVRLPARPSEALRGAPPPTPEAAASQVVVHAEAPLAPLQRTLEERVPQRLADGQVRIGPGGTVSYSVERGALSVRVSRTALLIEAPIRAKARACRGDDCYASCEPEARVVAEVPLMLRPDYGFQQASVSLSFTRACKIRTLGGLLTLDVTPTLHAQLQPELRRVARDIDEQLPRLEARIARAWAELSVPRPLPLGGCFVLQPFGVVQGPFAPSAVTLGGRFAILARPELRASCGDTPSVAPLPPLQTDSALPQEGVVRLGMVTALQSVGRAIEAGTAPRATDERLRVTRADVTSRGSEVDVQLALVGDICGEVGLAAALDFSGDGQHIRLSRAALWPGESERLVASKRVPGELAQALVGGARISPLLSVQAFKEATPALVAGLSQPSLEVRATVSSAGPAGAASRGDELVAWLEARGALSLKSGALPEP